MFLNELERKNPRAPMPVIVDTLYFHDYQMARERHGVGAAYSVVAKKLAADAKKCIARANASPTGCCHVVMPLYWPDVEHWSVAAIHLNVAPNSPAHRSRQPADDGRGGPVPPLPARSVKCYYFDSVLSDNRSREVSQYLAELYRQAFDVPNSDFFFRDISRTHEAPLQTNNTDCGVFCLLIIGTCARVRSEALRSRALCSAFASGCQIR